MDPLVITRSIDIAAPPHRVWAALTQPELITQWFGDGASFDLRPGGRGVLSWKDYGDFGMLVEDVDEPHSVAYRWTKDPGVAAAADNSTLVRFTLTPTTEGTRLTVEESGFEIYGDDAQAQYTGNIEGWDLELAELRELLERESV
jgi:uncharacterized protein YndB with AHSA1/START domain